MSKQLFRVGPFNNARWINERFITANRVEDVVKKIVEDMTRVVEKNLLAEQKKLITVDIYIESVRHLYRKTFERNIVRYSKLIEDLAEVKTEDDLYLVPAFKHYRIEKLYPINA